MESSFWDERYAQEAYVYGKQPNAFLEAFNPLQLNNFSGGPKSKDLLYTVNILAADFGDLSVTLLEEATTVLDEGAYHQGKADVVRLMATK